VASLTPEAVEAELEGHVEGIVFSENRWWMEEEKMVQMRLSFLADHAKRAGALKRLHSTASSSSDWGRLSSEEKAEGRAAFEAFAATPAGQVRRARRGRSSRERMTRRRRSLLPPPPTLPTN
jgi:hypothetical protein